MAEGRKLPGYVYLPPEAARRQAERTRDGTYKLISSEIPWKDRYHFLKQNGYQLRPRYNPSWEPSWKGTNLDPAFCEDYVVLSTYNVTDATRLSDNCRVAIKVVKRSDQELQISQFLTSIQHPANHCVSVYGTLDDPLDTSTLLMVMQYLTPWNEPEFSVLGDVVDFVTQMLEGLEFLHNQHVAHRDVASLNIMMNGSVLFPQGHHPVWTYRSPDNVYDLTPLQRMDHPVRYFYVDFGLSVRFQPGASTLVVGDVGRDAEVPELSWDVPYDPFKADIYALGNLFDKEFEQRYHSLQFLLPLIESMKHKQPEQRLTASELVQIFASTRKTLNPNGFRWRLGPKSEPAYERLFNDDRSNVVYLVII
ncbi:hypothetical protein VTO73DRAFT_2253 [Trametes versicolor]